MIEAIVDDNDAVDASVGPLGSLEMLSQGEIEVLLNTGRGRVHSLFRQCALAVMNSGSDIDNARELFDRYADFDVRVVRHPWGIRLEINNAPPHAFVDGQMIRGIKELLFAVLRDVVYITHEVEQPLRFDLSRGGDITNAVFHILRNSRVLDRKIRPNLVVCWGGHSISSEEYQYSKKVGYELGLRGLDVCTGCGPGAMKGPMKGATIGHAKQRITNGRYIGMSEPGIIAAEPPNAIVNQLVIMPDIEKRLEGFLRLAHGFVIFPGGVGTVEEILYLLGILLDPHNAEQPVPVVLTGPESAEGWFEKLREFLMGTVGHKAVDRLQFVVGNPAEVARRLVTDVGRVRAQRRANNDSYNFNWLLRVPEDFQHPFVVNHASMSGLELHRDLPQHVLLANLRRAFSGIVSGNVKEQGITEIDQHGPFELNGDPAVMQLLDELLRGFVADGRMKLPGSEYRPCYRIAR
ncbi:MAG: nucleotide 5'-monophosphate nucleosidase PpnN [Nevskiaceae bacterium]|nr:nucleotide 5'-monophosphate nucleosidase PpnN [Nevskiaceae bacterium]